MTPKHTHLDPAHKADEQARQPSHQAAAPGRESMPSERLMALQAGVGNAAVVQMLRRGGHSGAEERHEHSAGCDHPSTEQAAPSVQRSAVHDVLRAPGRPMDDATRTDMETRLGADFSDVRIHNDAAAKASAAEVGARAYTSGHHVVIGAGGTDKHTLAHELTHVIQQRSGPVAGTDNGAGLKVSDPSDRFEREAEAQARRVMSAAPKAAPLQRRAQPSPASAALPSVQRVGDAQNVMTTAHWEAKAGINDSGGQSGSKKKGGKGENKKANLMVAGKKKGKVGAPQTMDTIIKTVGPGLLEQLADKSPDAGQLDLFRSMSLAEAQSIMTYWGNAAGRTALTDYIATREGTGAGFREGGHAAMAMGVHLGDQEQADAYFNQNTPNYDVQLKFTLKPGAHELLFDPRYMALGPGYASELIREGMKDDMGESKGYQTASPNEGTLGGYIGTKAEGHGPFSLGLAQNKKDRTAATPSHLLFQLFIQEITVERDRNGAMQ
ncbi:DUF4157 domain-containing protein [Streptomyces sp. 404i]|uniref:eCIS core domain-containing protein n=1 Tax=Streptomyces sp. 404i TaxID=2824902 RepID=UPI0027E40681|nr:DUF4157 domain-containing protein [Streptomyces sp. 404i]